MIGKTRTELVKGVVKNQEASSKGTRSQVPTFEESKASTGEKRLNLVYITI
jgi:hypothetical protein